MNICAWLHLPGPLWGAFFPLVLWLTFTTVIVTLSYKTQFKFMQHRMYWYWNIHLTYLCTNNNFFKNKWRSNIFRLKNKSTETVNEKIVSLFISRISPFCSYIHNRKNNEKQNMKVIQDFENAMTNNFLLKIFTNFSKTNNYRRPFKTGFLSCTENILPKTASHFHSAKRVIALRFLGGNILNGGEGKGISAFLIVLCWFWLFCLFV